MRKTILNCISAVALSGALFSCTPKNNFHIEGTVTEGLLDTAYYVLVCDGLLESYSNPPVDSIIVEKNKFTYDMNIEKPTMGGLQAIFKDGTVCQNIVDFPFIPGESANVIVNNGFYDIDGSAFYHDYGYILKCIHDFNKEYSAYVSTLHITQETPEDSMLIYQTEVNRITKKFTEEISNYLKENNNSDGAYFGVAISRVFPIDSLEAWAGEQLKKGYINEFFQTLKQQEKTQQEAYEKQKKESEIAEQATAEGKMFTDFSVEYEGQVQKFSDYIGKGKYVLVDFWASWCGPCRQEIPNIINVYNKYKGDKFEVLGVASWDKPDDTKKAIEDLGIEYPQILNSQEIATDIYGIMGIPQIILFGPDGTILRRDLRGLEIETAVKEYLKK